MLQNLSLGELYFPAKPHSFKRFSILEEKCCADIINGWRQNNLQQIFSVRQILKKSTQTFFVHAETKNMTSFEVFSRVAWRHSWHRSSLELELLSYCFALREAYSEHWFSKTNSFLCGSMAWIQTILKLDEKKDYCACINSFVFKYAQN